MKSINLKLISSTSGMILAAILIIAIPSLKNQYSVLEETVIESASNQISDAAQSVNSFLDTPKRIVKDVSYYVIRSPLDLEQTQKDFENIIQGSPSLYCLYYADEIPISKNGKFYSSDKWLPDPDYDKETRDWFSAAKKTEEAIITEPYVDADTQALVTTIACAARDKGAFRGVVSIDIFLSELTSIVSNKKLTEGGKTFLIDSNGLYLTNDDFEKVQEANFFDDYKELNEYKKKFSNEVFLDTNAKAGFYIAGKVINEETGWILVTVGSSKEIYAQLRKNLSLIVFVAIIALIVSILLTIIISMTIVKPIKNVDDAINGIAEGNADLTQRLTASTKDEVGELVNGFNKFMKKLHGIIFDVKNSKNELSHVENELQQSINDTASLITEILSNVESVSTQVGNQYNSVSQTSSAVSEISENINSLERMIENQSSGVTQASTAVEEMLGNISSVNNSIEQMADSFSNLEQNTSEGIQKQNKVSEHVAEIEAQSKTLQNANVAISNVASQTNLLAMNAAIEAAHAGEAGKGFSVVADEIRKLSETSAAESKKISEELKKISESIKAVVIAARESSESFTGVGEKISQTDELVNHIKAAMREQQEGSKQILDALKLMNDSTSEVKTSSHEMAVGNQAILKEVQILLDATTMIKSGMTEMSQGASEMNKTSAMLSNISIKVNESINRIGTQIDQFKV